MKRLAVVLPALAALAAAGAAHAPAGQLEVVDRAFLCQSGRVGALPGFYVQAFAQNGWTRGQVDLLGQLYGPNAPRVSAQRGAAAITWNRKACRSTTTRIALEQGPLRAAYRDVVKCVLGGAILVRVRAVREGGRLVESRMAVAMQHKRRPMAYALTLRNGDARLYTRPGCDP